MSLLPDRFTISHCDAGWATLPPGTTYGPRKTVKFQLLYIERGTVEAQLDGIVYTAPGGSMILLCPDMIDFYRWDPNQSTRASYIHFRIDWEVPKIPDLQGWPRIRILPKGDIVRPLYAHLIDLIERDIPERQALIQSGFRHLLGSFLSGCLNTRPEGGAHLPEAVIRVLSQMHKRWSKDPSTILSLDELSELAHTSPGHLCRLFKTSVGYGPLQALRLLRLDRAAELLARSNLRIKEIAALTGFENPFHFSRRFRESFKLSPRTYRQQALLGKAIPHNSIIAVRRIFDTIGCSS